MSVLQILCNVLMFKLTLTVKVREQLLWFVIIRNVYLKVRILQSVDSFTQFCLKLKLDQGNAVEEWFSNCYMCTTGGT